jgi:nucleoside-diphosphate-sugar epimerase
MPTHLLVGGGGFIGTNLVLHLTSKGQRCVIVDNSSSPAPSRVLPYDVEAIHLDARDLDKVQLPRIDTVFYLAAHIRGASSDSRMLGTQGVSRVDELRLWHSKAGG